STRIRRRRNLGRPSARGSACCRRCAMADPIALVAKQIGRKARLLDEPAFRREIAAINQKFAKRMKRSFERTTRTWSRDVRFQQLTEVRPDPAVAVYTTDAIYGYVSGGTRVRR